MTVNVSTLQFTQSPSTGGIPKYGVDDLGELENNGAKAFTQMSAIYDGNPSFLVVIGINGSGGLMVSPSDKAALPCPIYCVPPQAFVALEEYGNE